MTTISKQDLTGSPDFIAQYGINKEQQKGSPRLWMPVIKGEIGVRIIYVQDRLGQGAYKKVFAGQVLYGEKCAISIASPKENSDKTIEEINTHIQELRHIFRLTPPKSILLPELVQSGLLVYNGEEKNVHYTQPVHCQVSPKFDTSLEDLNKQVQEQLKQPLSPQDEIDYRQVAIDNTAFVSKQILGEDGIMQCLLKHKIAHNDMHFDNYLVKHSKNCRIRKIVLIDWDKASHFQPPHPENIDINLQITSCFLRTMPSHMSYQEIIGRELLLTCKADLVMYMLWKANPSLKLNNHPFDDFPSPFTSPPIQKSQLLKCFTQCAPDRAIDIMYEIQKLFISSVRSDLDPQSDHIIVSPFFNLLRSASTLNSQLSALLPRQHRARL